MGFGGTHPKVSVRGSVRAFGGVWIHAVQKVVDAPLRISGARQHTLRVDLLTGPHDMRGLSSITGLRGSSASDQVSKTSAFSGRGSNPRQHPRSVRSVLELHDRRRRPLHLVVPRSGDQGAGLRASAFPVSQLEVRRQSALRLQTPEPLTVSGCHRFQRPPIDPDATGAGSRNHHKRLADAPHRAEVVSAVHLTPFMRSIVPSGRR